MTVNQTNLHIYHCSNFKRTIKAEYNLELAGLQSYFVIIVSSIIIVKLILYSRLIINKLNPGLSDYRTVLILKIQSLTKDINKQIGKI